MPDDQNTQPGAGEDPGQPKEETRQAGPERSARGPEEAFERCRDTLDDMMGSDHQRREVVKRLVEQVEGRG